MGCDRSALEHPSHLRGVTIYTTLYVRSHVQHIIYFVSCVADSKSLVSITIHFKL